MSKITKDMGIMDIVTHYPETLEVFAKYGMGCIGCAAARFENLEAGAKVHGIDADEMVCAMNEIIEKEIKDIAATFCAEKYRVERDEHYACDKCLQKKGFFG